MNEQLQQGDTIYQKLDSLPHGLNRVERKSGAVIIAEGEHTGHAHRIFDAETFLFELNGKRYLENKKPVTVTHEEHHPITIPSGIWELGIVREKDWLSGMVRKVID